MPHKKYIRYIIVGSARSGTTVTHLAIMGHPNVSALNDELNALPFFEKGFSTFTSGAEMEKEEMEGLSRLFDTLTSVYMDENTMAREMKTTIQSIAAAEIFIDALKTKLSDVKVILTSRKDLVAQCASLKLAHKTGKFHSWVRTKRTSQGKIHLRKNDFILYAYEQLKIIKLLRSLKHTHAFLECNYEEKILPNQQEYFQSLFKFLTIPNISIDWLSSKKVSPPPEDYIAIIIIISL